MELKLKNHMEIVVSNVLKSIHRNDHEICQCENCSLDMQAIALNRLPPRYFVTEAGGVYNKARELEVQFEADVTRELIEAASLVKERPRH